MNQLHSTKTKGVNNAPIICWLCLIASMIWVSCNRTDKQETHLDSLQNELDTKRVTLPNGWSLSPAGTTLPLGDLPLNLVVSPTGKFMAVTNNGQSTQSIMLIDPVSETVLHEAEIKKSWYGLAFNSDETRLYASGGNANMIVVY